MSKSVPYYRCSFVSRKNYVQTIRYKQINHIFPQIWRVEWRQKIQVLSKILEDAFLECAALKNMMTVRVLLSSVSLSSSSCRWSFTADAGVVLYEIGERQNKKICTAQSITVEISKGSVFYNGKKRDLPCMIVPHKGCMAFNNTLYDGSFLIYPYKNDVLCINCVDLEHYVCSVLKTESWPGWPLEVNKVFAIACRSYVVSQAQSACRTKKPFHVKNNNEHQTYQGKHDNKLLYQAVDQTRGCILGCTRNRPVLAMFDSCCGGIIPAQISDFDFTKAPYLAREYACTYCVGCSLYTWKHIYTRREFRHMLMHHVAPLRYITAIRVIKDAADIVTEVIFYERNKSVCVTGKKLYSLIKEIKSFSFDIRITKDSIILNGHGFGHHIGLCQWGVREMVRQGWDYKSILRFYYPGTRIMKIVN